MPVFIAEIFKAKFNQAVAKKPGFSEAAVAIWAILSELKSLTAAKEKHDGAITVTFVDASTVTVSLDGGELVTTPGAE